MRQTADWTCSCASLAWVMNALGVGAPSGGKWDEWDGVNELRRLCGYSAVSPDYGLAYGNGQDLETVYNEYGFSVQRTPGIDWASLAQQVTLSIGQMSGGRWYHWTGLRAYDADADIFYLANPAPSWKGVGDDLDQGEWWSWGGWNAVMVTGRL
ncbi:MAG: hypothetical protein J2P17_30035 [Mycobacterium sp.]|nr:hypothetical protein [Mycobacterium sp.]